jgi:hypothetical protein
MPVFACGPVPLMISLITSFLGTGPVGTVTVGSVESGPLVGVVSADTAGVVAVGVEAEPVDFVTVSAAFVVPPEEVVPLELLEPQPTTRTPAASAAKAKPLREQMAWKSLK